MTAIERLEGRMLPDYTRTQEIANTVTHIIGGVFGIAVLVQCILTALFHGTRFGVVGGAIFGGTMIVLYTISSLYHGLLPCVGKKVLQTIDHCTIYFFIAGTYTPILICAIAKKHPVAAIAILAIEWGVAALATVFTAIDLNKYAKLSMVFYITMGWCIIAVFKYALEAIGTAGFIWLISGGVAYTVGAVLYGIGKHKNPIYHTVFHIFVLIGSLLQTVCILFYVL